MKAVFAILALSGFGASFGVPLALAQEDATPARCLITVETVTRGGTTQKRELALHLKSESECARAAKRHSHNFNPASIEKVSVSYKWVKK